MAFRKTKSLLEESLKKGPLSFLDISSMDVPLASLVSPLFSFLPSTDRAIRWHAVSSLGRVTEAISKNDLEQARVVIRRLMWQLNDESGGIGWGCPEAMGDILARVKPLAAEYSNILVSYVYEEENYLEQLSLVGGALWGIARVSETSPELVKRAIPALMDFLRLNNPEIRIYCLLALENLNAIRDTKIWPEPLRDDGALIYWNERFQEMKVSELMKNLWREENGTRKNR